jgi:hypothetical protein
VSVFAAAAQAQSQTNWAVVLVTALGSSIIGGVCGGLLTTLLRGRIEKDQATTTRLIDAADGYLEQRVRANVVAMETLELLRDQDAGAWEEEADMPLAPGQQAIEKMADAEDNAEVALERVRLLYGLGSPVAAKGLETVTNAKQMIHALRGTGHSPRGDLLEPMGVKWTRSDQKKRDAALGALLDVQRAHHDFMLACERVVRKRLGPVEADDTPAPVEANIIDQALDGE